MTEWIVELGGKLTALAGAAAKQTTARFRRGRGLLPQRVTPLIPADEYIDRTRVACPGSPQPG
ncbi:hypothetical protein [Salinisphaera hydrothermalis]|uniref:hypothetical protein n=1 Tax=Salinisphaera hydrothermalis TaxID=563188 RepID=UPI00334294A3